MSPNVRNARSASSCWLGENLGQQSVLALEVMVERAFRQSRKLDPVLEKASPFIVRLDGTELLGRWRCEGEGKAWGIQCTSEMPLEAVRRHFRKFLQAELPDGRRVLFRFYDPRVWRVYWPTCNEEEKAQWMEGVGEVRVSSAT